MRTLYRAALVRTLTYPQTGEWLLTDGRHVERVGSGEPPAADRIVDLPGATSDIVVLDIADSCRSGLASVARHRPDVLLLDQRLPDGLGPAFCPPCSR